MAICVGLDIGGSTTKIVAMQDDTIIGKCVVKAADPITSAYGALGRLTDEIGIRLGDIERINITGVGSGFMQEQLFGIKTKVVQEFEATGLGGLFLSGKNNAIVVSMGTGTAYLDASKNRVKHIIGSGVGGGTIVGLCNAVLNVDDANKLSDMAAIGNIDNVDLSIGDISKSEIPGLPMNITASNFGKVTDDLSKEDKAVGIFNLVYQTIGTIAVLAARMAKLSDIVFTGQLTTLSQCKEVADCFSKLYDMNFIMPEDAVFATAIGACISQTEV